MKFQAKVQVWLRPGIADPEGHTVSEAINALGYDGVGAVRMGKIVSLSLVANSADEARAKISEISTSLLSNPVLEDVIVEIDEA